jgi:uncharacterized membrane protein YhaH (DUF805 family)/ATP-dependent protease ClpP protease subunit
MFVLKSILNSFKKSFNIKERSSRADFFYFLIFISVIEIVLILVHVNILKSNFIPGDSSSPFYKFTNDPVFIFSILTLIPTFSITARRLNDVNQSIWRLIAALISWLATIYIFNQYLNFNDLSSNIPFIIAGAIVLYILKGVFYISDESIKDSPSDFQENSLISPILFIVISTFSISWNPQYLYEIEYDADVVTNPHLTEIKSKGFIGTIADSFGLSDCTHTLQDGTCFTDGSYSIINTLEIETPNDLSNFSSDINDLDFKDIFVAFSVEKTEIRHVRRNNVTSSSCYIDHIEFQGGVNEDLLFLMKGLLNQINSDINRCTDNGQPIAIDVYLSSPGGYVLYGTMLAAEMKKLGVTTHITPDQLCGSMCTELFLAGKDRIMHANSQLGFHSAYIPMMGKNSFVCAKSMSESIYYFLEKKLADIVVSDFLNVCNPVMLKNLNPGSAVALGLATKSF